MPKIQGKFKSWILADINIERHISEHKIKNVSSVGNNNELSKSLKEQKWNSEARWNNKL